jgi:type II secretory pathway pseudopilin PulG
LTRGFDVVFPHYAKFRELARLLALEGNGRREAGDIPGATRSYLDAVTMGNRIPRGGGIIARLVGIACQAIGRRPIWRMVGQMNAPTAKAAARRIETLRKETWPYVETVTEEKYVAQTAFLEGFRNPAKAAIAAAPEGEPDNREGAPLAAQAYFFVYSKQHIMHGLTKFLDRLIADASKPYANRTRPDPTPNDPLAQTLVPTFVDARLKQVASEETQNALLNLALALRAYRMEHGTYPSDLGQLVPAYIAHVPNDPFAHSDPLIYRKEADDYVLYSIGPDGVDNAGRAIENPGDTESKRRAVTSSSTGDIVAGVNVY